MLSKFNIICGHYGSGKTNLALNLAFDLCSQGKKVTIVDLDIVDPYFRTSDYTDELTAKGIKVIAPILAGTNVDVPALPAAIASVFEDSESYIFLDVGGDDSGAGVLGRYAKQIEKTDYRMLYVINKFRKLISNENDAVELMREIESASRLKVTGLVNNSHLSSLTTEKDILNSLPYAEKVSEISGVPLEITTAPKELKGQLASKVNNLYTLDIIVKLPWADKNS